MVNKNILIKRLSHIKQLYKIGIKQSQQHENIAVFSILTFHDSIEMFLRLVAEHKNIKTKNFSFMTYWEKIPDLTLKESMRKLNERRVQIKHRGMLPARSEVEISKVNTIEFFEQNTKKQFGVEFNDISLIDLIGFEKVRHYLSEAQMALDSNQREKSIEYSAYAFNELLYSFEKTKESWGRSPFYFGKKNIRFDKFRNSHIRKIDERGELSDFTKDVVESINALKKAVKITSLGLDYKEFGKFDILTPTVTRVNNRKLVAELYGQKKWSKENCQFCIDFVVNSALHLQEFDFNIESLEDFPNEFIDVVEKS